MKSDSLIPYYYISNLLNTHYSHISEKRLLKLFSEMCAWIEWHMTSLLARKIYFFLISRLTIGKPGFHGLFFKGELYHCSETRLNIIYTWDEVLFQSDNLFWAYAF